MTQAEKTEVANYVLQAIQSNSSTIAGLTTTTTLVAGDYFELNGGKKISYSKLRDLLRTYISTKVIEDVTTAINGKVDEVEGKGLSTNDLTDDMVDLLDLISPDWYGSQVEYNALATHDATRNYFITLEDEVVAVYRGENLITAVPNMVGEFTADSTEDDWYWWPNGVKTRMPVDPSTCRFSYYWPGQLTNAQRLFTPVTAESDFLKCKLKRLEKIPVIGTASVYAMLSMCGNLEVLPVIDLKDRTTQYVGYICLPGGSNKVKWKRLSFANTSGVTKWEMVLNGNFTECVCLTGLDLSSTISFVSTPLALKGIPYVQLTNLGKAAAATSFDLRNKNWGNNTLVAGARQSLVDSLLTNSFDRAAAGYAAATITLSAEVFARLTASEVSAITAKGFTIVTQ